MSSEGSLSDSGSQGAPSPDASALNALNGLKFSILNILQPEFGQKSQLPGTPPTTPPAALLFPGLNAANGFALGLLGPILPQLLGAAAAAPPDNQQPAWVYCTRYSDRPSAGPRTRKMKRKGQCEDEKRPRTAFTPEQLDRLKQQFQDNRYLTEKRRQELAHELGLNESQIKIWFQNKRAKLKKAALQRPDLPFQLMPSGSVPLSSLNLSAGFGQ